MSKEIKVIIENEHDLYERVQEYKQMFPETYTTPEQIREGLKRRVNEPKGLIFGISVSSEWKEKCYGIEVEQVTPETTTFRYLGIWKV